MNSTLLEEDPANPGVVAAETRVASGDVEMTDAAAGNAPSSSRRWRLGRRAPKPAAPPPSLVGPVMLAVSPTSPLKKSSTGAPGTSSLLEPPQLRPQLRRKPSAHEQKVVRTAEHVRLRLCEQILGAFPLFFQSLLQVHGRDYPGGEADLLRANCQSTWQQLCGVVLATGDTSFLDELDSADVCGEQLFALIDEANGGSGRLTVLWNGIAATARCIYIAE